jgi:hypothetical protein
MQVKLVLQHNKFYVESPDEAILRKLAKDPVISDARVLPEDASGDDFQVTACTKGNPVQSMWLQSTMRRDVPGCSEMS